MSAYPLRPLMVALYDTLSGDATLMTALTGIYDHVPEDAELPYLVFGDNAAVKDALIGAQAFRCDVALDVYSREGGRKALMEITARIHALLDHQPLSVDGFETLLVSLRMAETERQADGLTTRVRMALRCQLMEAA